MRGATMTTLRPTLLWRCRRLWLASRIAFGRTLVLTQPAAALSASTFAAEASPAQQEIGQHAAAISTAAPVQRRKPQKQQRPRHWDTEGWPGLGVWRAAAVDERLQWGEKSAREAVLQPQATGLGASLAECAQQVLLTADPREKAFITHKAWQAYKSGRLPMGAAEAPGAPARPPKPELVHPKQIPSGKLSPLPLNVYMLHNLAHIELNAIDLAWDTVVRFSSLDLPRDFYADFARVADDEARHLLWCMQRLEELGYEYGCMPAHNLLWEGGEMSAGDLFARLAVVPMSQEARGLDAGLRLAEKLVGLGDNRSAAIVVQIALEERNHVAVGVAWFQAICEALQVEAGPAFRSLLLDLCPDLLKGPFNHEERGMAGLPRSWYDTSLWPEEQRAIAESVKKSAGKQPEQQQLGQLGEGGAAAPAAAAAESIAAEASRGAAEGPVHGPREALRPCVPRLAQRTDAEQLQRLRQRLAAMLEIEVRMA